MSRRLAVFIAWAGGSLFCLIVWTCIILLAMALFGCTPTHLSEGLNNV